MGGRLYTNPLGLHLIKIHRIQKITNERTNQLHGAVLLEKPIFPRQVNEVPLILYNRKLHYPFHKSLLLVPIPSQKNPVQSLQTDFLNVYFNITLPSTPKFSQWSLFFRFPQLSFPMRANVPPITLFFI